LKKLHRTSNLKGLEKKKLGKREGGRETGEERPNG